MNAEDAEIKLSVVQGGVLYKARGTGAGFCVFQTQLSQSDYRLPLVTANPLFPSSSVPVQNLDTIVQRILFDACAVLIADPTRHLPTRSLPTPRHTL
jgi:hypothetical protein